MTENNLQAAIVRYLNTLPNTVARVNGPGPAHVVGDPDIYGCVGGLMFHMEVKAEKGLVSPIQEHRMHQWQTAGAKVYVVRSMDDAKAAHSLAHQYANIHALVD